MQQSIWDTLNGAWGTLWIILGLSVVAVAVALERLIVQWRFKSRARTLADTVMRCLSRGAVDESRSACERSRSPLADVFLVGYERLGRVKSEHVDTAVHRERVRVVATLKSRLWMIGTIGAVSPFVGLFGTVVGIMGAFESLKMAEDSGQTGIGVVSGDIAHALIATAFGIGVAVLAVVIYNFFNQRLASLSVELRMLTDEFMEHLHESGATSSHSPRRSKDADKAARASKDKDDSDKDDSDGNR